MFVIALPAVAHANAPRYTHLVDPDAVDAPCRSLAAIPASSEISGPAFDAAISTANCLVELRTHRLHLTLSADSVHALDDAVAPAIHILDRVIERGDAEHALLARYSKLDIFVGNTTRLLAAVPRIGASMTDNDTFQHDHAVILADALTEPWRRREELQRRDFAYFVASHPGLATRDRVLAYVVAHSRIVAGAAIAAPQPRG
jgi:hypothetical protein